MIYITGDIHGSFSGIRDINRFCIKNKTTTDDYIIMLGDVAFNYYLDDRDILLKEKARKVPITFLCVHGNHEARPESIPGKYREVEMFGDTCYIEDTYPNIVFLKDGGIYTIEDKKFLCLGGAYSVDKEYRQLVGYQWFADEQTSEEKRNLILQNVSGETFDIVISHTCPYEWRPTDLFLTSIDQSKVDSSQELWLSEVKEKINYKVWCFGHYHSDREYKKERAIMYFKTIGPIRRCFDLPL